MLSSAVGCVQREPSVSPSGGAGGGLGVSAQVWASWSRRENPWLLQPYHGSPSRNIRWRLDLVTIEIFN